MSPTCCSFAASSFGLLHRIDCPTWCTAHLAFNCPGGPHIADDFGRIISSGIPA